MSLYFILISLFENSISNLSANDVIKSKNNPIFVLNLNANLGNKNEVNYNLYFELLNSDSLKFIKYIKTVIESQQQLDSIKNEYGNLENNFIKYRVITTINRKDIKYFKINDTILIPDKFDSDINNYSIFPKYILELDSISKIVLVSNKFQCYSCYEFGEMVYFAACNTGSRVSPTPPGKYYSNWKRERHFSSIDPSWFMPYTVNLDRFGRAFHQFTMRGYPLSHSCIRQFMHDAAWIYHWAETRNKKNNFQYFITTKTPVIILDRFDFSRRNGGPWLDFTDNCFRYEITETINRFLLK